MLEAGRGDKLRAASVANSSTYRFRFFRAGGVDQVDLADEEALTHLDALDRKLWVALACPIEGLEIDNRSLGFIDTDGDGRIRPPEILAAIAWAKEAFADLSGFFDGKDELSLASLSKKTETGRAVHDAARRILTNLGRPDDDVLHLADVTNVERVFEQTRLNGDGIVPIDAANDEPTRKAIADILEVMGSVRDRSGKRATRRSEVESSTPARARTSGLVASGTEMSLSSNASKDARTK